MAVAMFLRFSGLTPSQYDRLMASFEFDVSPPIGEVLHVAVEAEGGIEVLEVWQTREAAEAFVDEQLWPRLAELRISAEVEKVVFPLHNLYAPDLDTVERIGAVSLPAMSAGSVLRY